MAVGDAGVGRAPAPPQSSGCSVHHLLRDEDESAAQGKEESVSRVVAQRVGRHRGGERGPCGQRGAAGPGPRSCGAVAGRGGADLRPQSSVRCWARPENGQTLALERCLRMQRGGWGLGLAVGSHDQKRRDGSSGQAAAEEGAGLRRLPSM